MKRLALLFFFMIYFYYRVGKEMKNNKKRQTNFELMRIISMILIIIWHIIIHSGIREGTSGTINLLVQFIYIFISIHVNSFVLVSGYFGYEKSISYKKILSLFYQTWFYKAIFVIVFVTFGISKISTVQFVRELLPLNTEDYWFINCYLVLCMISPYINVLIKKLNQQEHKRLIVLMIFLFSLIPILSSNRTISNHGSTIQNFILLYLIGAYLGKYPINCNIHFKNYSHNKRQCIFLFGFIFFGILNFLFFQCSQCFMKYSNPFIQELGKMYNIFETSFSNPLIILQSIFYFLYFSTLCIKSSVINKFSSLCFGVYLIHENHHFYNYFYHFIKFDTLKNYNDIFLIFKIVLLAIIIFQVCTIIELLRRLLFRFFSSRKVIKKFNNMIYDYIKSF